MVEVLDVGDSREDRIRDGSRSATIAPARELGQNSAKTKHRPSDREEASFSVLRKRHWTQALSAKQGQLQLSCRSPTTAAARELGQNSVKPSTKRSSGRRRRRKAFFLEHDPVLREMTPDTNIRQGINPITAITRETSTVLFFPSLYNNGSNHELSA